MWPHFWRSSILSSYFFQFWTLRSCVSILGMGNFRLKIHEPAQCEAILVECLLQFVKCDKRLSFHDPLKPTKCCKPDRFWLVNFSKNDRSKKIRRTWGQGHVYFKLLSKYVLNGLALNNAYHRQSNPMFFSFNCEMFCCNPFNNNWPFSWVSCKNLHERARLLKSSCSEFQNGVFAKISPCWFYK